MLILKDFRLFRRDPVQWSQVLIFLGLLAGYFFNIRWFQYDQFQTAWINMVSFLNVSVVGLLLSTFTTRFIFPMISLEGRRFWVLGLLPVPRETILWSKFGFAVVGSIVPCSLLILLSDVMLGVSTTLVINHQVTCAMLCAGLSSIAVGLGARLPNLRETSPSRIAAGFGGTLNLVLSTLYIVLVLLLATLPAHLWPAWPSDPTRADPVLSSASPGWQPWLALWYFAGLPAALGLAVVASVVPLWVGARAFAKMEF